ncbi:MAG: PAS domain S-box protein, partial [Thermoleophilaceae bacterium]
MNLRALTRDAFEAPSTLPDRRDNELTRSILQSAHEAFVSIDATGVILAWNRAAEQTFGWPREEACGRSMAELIIPERHREAHYCGVQRFLETGEAGVSGRRLELAALHRDGREVPIELTIAPTRLDGETVFNAFLHDISDRRAAEAEARRLAAIVETSDDAVMSGALDGTVTSWNRGAERLYGYSSDEMVGESISRVRPTGDLREVRDLQARLARGEHIREYETREIRKDGSSVDVLVSMSPLTDESGRIVGVASIARDVTARKASERALQEAHARFQGAFEAAPIGMALVDLDGRFLSANAALCDLVGRSEEELTRLDVRAVTHQDDVHLDVEQVQRVLDGEIDRFELEKRYVRPDGTIAWGLLCASLVRGPAGEPVHFVRQMQDITERKETEEQLREHLVHLNELALRDPLTGLPNQRDFDTAVDRETKRVRRHGGGFGVVVLEVDGFSRLNERHGRMEGDRILRRLGTALTAVSRGSDVAARLRDDQFALLLPETAGEGAEATAER